MLELYRKGLEMVCSMSLSTQLHIYIFPKEENVEPDVMNLVAWWIYRHKRYVRVTMQVFSYICGQPKFLFTIMCTLPDLKFDQSLIHVLLLKVHLHQE